MIIRDKGLLAEMRRSPRCHFCGRPTPTGCDPAHVLSRGAGGSDIRSNVAALCRGFTKDGWESCHDKHHAGVIKSDELWRMIAQRDGRTFDDVKAEVFLVRRWDKHKGMPPIGGKGSYADSL